MFLALVLALVDANEEELYRENLAGLMTVPLAGTDGRVSGIDAYRFLSHTEASDSILSVIRKHRLAIRAEVFSWNRYDVFGQWERDIESNLLVWSELQLIKICLCRGIRYEPTPTESDPYSYIYRKDTALETVLDVCQHLNKLRAMIGDEAYLSGVVPDLFPHYQR